MLTMKQVDDRLKRLSGRYTTINSDVQDMAVAIVAHANETGDCDRARKIVRCLPAKMRPLLTVWFTEVSPINVTMGKTAKDDTVSLRKEGKKNYKPFDIEKAKANKWFEDPFKKAPTEELNTIQTYYDAAERLFERMARDTKEGAEKVNPDDIERVKALRSAIRAAFVEFHEANPVADPSQSDGEGEATEEADTLAEQVARAAA